MCKENSASRRRIKQQQKEKKNNQKTKQKKKKFGAKYEEGKNITVIPNVVGVLGTVLSVFEDWRNWIKEEESRPSEPLHC